MNIGIVFIMLASATLAQAEGITVKSYGQKHKLGGMFFNAVICAFAAIFFIVKEIVLKGVFEVPVALIPYALASCFMYALGFYTMYLALQWGSFGMTRLITSFNGIIAIVYGIVFLGERPHFVTYIAIVLVFAAVFLMRIEDAILKKDGEENQNPISVGWLICVALCVISNGMIAVLSKAQQNVFGGECDGEFKALSYIGAFVLLAGIGILRERKNIDYILKHGMTYGMIAGVINGANNFLQLVVYALADLSVASSMLTGMGLIASFAVSAVIYKEKFTRIQLISVGIGFLAFILFGVSSFI